MSYDPKNLSVLAYANGFTLWHYTTDVSTVLSPAGYFNEAADMLRKGDVIIAHVGATGTTNAQTVVVRSSHNGVVQVVSTS